MTHEEAEQIVREAIVSTLPGADVDALMPGEKFRDALEMDSLDFLSFVEALNERTGARIDEDDYGLLTTLQDSAGFLARTA